MNLALFDFDGTISCRDSFLHFLWSLDRTRLLSTLAFASPAVILFWLRRLEADRLKELFLTRMVSGHHEDELGRVAERYCATLLPTIIRDGFWPRLDWHRRNGDTVAVVSASPRLVLAPWCRDHGIDLIATELEVDGDGRLTGKIAGANCKAEEKVKRIAAAYELSGYAAIYAYGDTPSDLPMLRLAAPGNRFYRPFRSAS